MYQDRQHTLALCAALWDMMQGQGELYQECLASILWVVYEQWQQQVEAQQ